MGEGHLRVRSGYSEANDAQRAAAEIAQAVEQPGMSLVLFFCSAEYDLDRLGSEMARLFDCPVAGCTSAGEIVPGLGYRRGGLVAVSLASPLLTATPLLIPGLDAITTRNGLQRILDALGEAGREGAREGFGLLLVDGLSLREEILVSTLHEALHGLPVVGGSAADHYRFRRTAVYHDGAFHDNAAVFLLVRCGLPFHIFQLKHIAPTDERLVITAADPETRTVQEINGEPAAEEYARLVGRPVDALDDALFADRPLMLRVGGSHFVRSIRGANPDGSLSFHCAIDVGLVVRIGRAGDLLGELRDGLGAVEEALPDPALLFGCDCILRRTQLESGGADDEAGALLGRAGMIGFNSYGEQCDGLHLNQTLTGVAIGRLPHGSA